jgi:tRNA/tmRNA/rRNA uracil-C5-methylase (TrmA/RlmC/RlmD family)
VILDVERVAHGGSCVAHADDGRVVFVRHTLPGERVRAVVTEERSSYLRADAVEVLAASPHRVSAMCPHAGPGKCGGCDWQHVELAEQRRLKAAVVEEQLSRLAGIERSVVVEPVPDDATGFDWRTRMRFVSDDTGRLGLRRHRSHDIEPISVCLIAVPEVDVADLVSREWSAGVEVTVDVSATGQRAVAVGVHPDTVVEVAAGREWHVPVGGFWQVHRGAASLLVEAVLRMAGDLKRAQALDLYAGVGLFAGALAEHGATVIAVESDRRAVVAARRNLAGLPVEVVADRVDHWLRRAEAMRVDVAVLDPPRRGAGKAVVQRLAAMQPGRIVYVACDPASLARDTATLAGCGYALGELAAYDLFPMTAHVECVALFVPTATA